MYVSLQLTQICGKAISSLLADKMDIVLARWSYTHMLAHVSPLVSVNCHFILLVWCPVIGPVKLRLSQLRKAKIRSVVSEEGGT